jgi:hypothetical protein
MATKMSGSVKKIYRFSLLAALAVLAAGFVYLKNWYTNPDFGKTFGRKAQRATERLAEKQELFVVCAPLCGVQPRFMQALVFPEVMRFHALKDDIETESLRTLYVQFGAEYANFSIGLFQMKPGFAETVEQKAKALLPVTLYNELQLAYEVTDAEDMRAERVRRLCDEEYQMIYLTAFIAICDKIYIHQKFTTELHKLQWYATVYNAGFDKTNAAIAQKIKQENFYLEQGMPGKKFRYAAIVAWYYQQPHPIH